MSSATTGWTISPCTITIPHRRMQTVQAAAALNEEAGELTVFAINADREEDQELSLDVRGFEGWRFEEHLEMYQPDPDSFNSWEHPDVNVPRKNQKARMEKGLLTAVLRPESWNVLRFSRK